MFDATVLIDAVSPSGKRFLVMEATFPRVILAEYNTNGMIRRNAASSRAIPTDRLIQRTIDDPFIPDFRLNKAGMQAGDALDEADAMEARAKWLEDRDAAIEKVRWYQEKKVHKQYVNRLLEPWMWCTIITSATEWANMFYQRISPAAEPSYNTIAIMMRDAVKASTPQRYQPGQWTLPLIGTIDKIEAKDRWGTESLENLKQIAVARCGRVSYLTHNGKRDLDEDLELFNRLLISGHWSPFEHVATPLTEGFSGTWSGPLCGWKSFRKSFPNENVPGVGVDYDPALVTDYED